MIMMMMIISMWMRIAKVCLTVFLFYCFDTLDKHIIYFFTFFSDLTKQFQKNNNNGPNSVVIQSQKVSYGSMFFQDTHYYFSFCISWIVSYILDTVFILDNLVLLCSYFHQSKNYFISIKKKNCLNKKYNLKCFRRIR